MSDSQAGSQQAERAALAAFEATLNPKAQALVEVVQDAPIYSSIDWSRRKIVIDLHAILQAALAYGVRSSGNAASWLVAWMEKSGASIGGDAPVRHPPEEISKAVAEELPIILSATLRNVVIPRAQQIALMTVGRNVCDLRHVIMSLLHEPITKWRDLGFDMSGSRLIEARRAIVDPLAKNHERGERTTVWRELVTKVSDTIPAEPPRQAKTPQPPAPEAVPIHTDDPAIVDQLGRDGFAKVLADRIIEARARAAEDAKRGKDEDDNRAFIVHMHGPWGSGKSTVLNFIGERLKTAPEPWLIVEFNAWRSQRLAPPWWSLMLAIQRAAIKRGARGRGRQLWLSLRWYWMRARADIVPMIGGFALLALAIAFGALLLYSPGSAANEAGQAAVKQVAAGAGDVRQVTAAANAAANAAQASILGVTKDVFASLAAVATGIGAIITFGRSLLFGSGSAARTYEALRGDPYGPMMILFKTLVEAVGQPIIVFVDDLDRCDRAYVCDLLENIQTMLRAAPITYLIAADRKWITTSFEKRYADFADLGTDAGRPLGYQFLDKLFQISATLPVIPQTLREQFWSGLLRSPPSAGTEATVKSDHSVALAKAKLAVAGARSFEDLQAAAKAEADPLVQQAIRAEGASRISGTAAHAATEHRLKHMGALIEANPRAMKRLANAVGLNLARAQIEGRDEVSFEGVARWTIVELRWPLLADWLSANPARIEGAAEESDPWGESAAVRKLLEEPGVKAVIGGAKDKGRLNAKSLAALIS